jgi:hypothetical protein
VWWCEKKIIGAIHKVFVPESNESKNFMTANVRASPFFFIFIFLTNASCVPLSG